MSTNNTEKHPETINLKKKGKEKWSRSKKSKNDSAEIYAVNALTKNTIYI